jgi:integrase
VLWRSGSGLPRITIHGLRRTFNNLCRQVAAGQVVRAITGHVTDAMTVHYSHVDKSEKHAAADRVLQLVRSSGGSENG